MKRLLACLVFSLVFCSYAVAQEMSAAPVHDTHALEPAPASLSAAPAHDAHAVEPGQPTPSVDQIWSNLLEGNERFVAGHAQPHDLIRLRQKLASAQMPKVIVLRSIAST